MAYAFGQDLVVWFFPLVDNEPPTLTTALQTQAPTIYVFSSRPSRDAAAAGTSAVGSSITSWTWDDEKKGWYFTVSAISDPDTDSEDQTENYFLAINFLLKTAGQVQTVIQHLPLERVRGVAKELLVEENDLRAIFSGVVSYGTSPDRKASIVEAKGLLKAHLTARGFEWCRIHNLHDLRRAAAYKALALICLGQNQAPNDKFIIKYGEYDKIATSLFDSLKLEYDSTNDNVPDSETPAEGTVLLLR